MNQNSTHRYRVRIRYAKQGHLRFMGHRDLIRALERIFRRAKVELAMSEGFHPRPRMRFCDPLAVGQAGIDEVMDLKLLAPRDENILLQQLNEVSVPGLEFVQIDALDESVAKLKAKSFCYELYLNPESEEKIKRKVGEFLTRPAHRLQKKKGGSEIDIRPLVLDLRIENGCLKMQLAATQEAGVRPVEMLELLGVSAMPSNGAVLTRTAVQL